MDKERIKKEITEQINEKEALELLTSLVQTPSENCRPTEAQQIVRRKLEEMNFRIETFPCAVDEIKDLPDFCLYEGNLESSEDIWNIVANSQEEETEHSFLIHAHIDTSARSEVMPDFQVEIKDGKIYGLGVADDKGGVAMMLYAAQIVWNKVPELKNKLILMSTIGKRGAVGTLTAFSRGYHADAAIYLHPAETGHGFREIKNYSMGTLDFNMEIEGKPGIFRDEIDDSEISAVTEAAKIIPILQQWEKERRASHFFQEDTFSGLPNTKLNIMYAKSSRLLREDVLQFDIGCRVCFGLGETVEEVFDEIREYIRIHTADDPWLQEHPPKYTYGEIKATPAYVSRDSRLIRTLEKNITEVKQFNDFIYQYHGSSDIRMPIVYGGTPTVGIGPLCGGLSENNGKEWMSIEDYLDGIRIVANMIVDWCV